VVAVVKKYRMETEDRGKVSWRRGSGMKIALAA
jgi:hypothetical protein